MRRIGPSGWARMRGCRTAASPARRVWSPPSRRTCDHRRERHRVSDRAIVASGASFPGHPTLFSIKMGTVRNDRTVSVTALASRLVASVLEGLRHEELLVDHAHVDIPAFALR